VVVPVSLSLVTALAHLGFLDQRAVKQLLVVADITNIKTKNDCNLSAEICPRKVIKSKYKRHP